ncbi:hypothetical protein Dimus_004828 [Dionaea muscipula]
MAAHHTTTTQLRRSSDSLDQSKPLDPTPTNHPKPTVYNLTKHYSKPHTSDRTTRAQNPPHPQKKKAVDTHLQGKSLSKSAILGGSSNSNDGIGPFSFTQEKEKTVRIARDQSKRAVLGKDKKAVLVVEEVVGKGSEKIKRGGDGAFVEEAVLGIAKVGGKVSKGEEEECVGQLEAEDGQKASMVVVVNGGRGRGGRPVGAAGRPTRMSFCAAAQVELGDFFVKNGVRVVSVDMPPFMQIHAVSCARKTCDSLEKFTSKALAFTLKKELDGAYGPAWHCIVGSSFGSFVTHSVGGFLYFSMDQKLHILLFKTIVQIAAD